MHNELLAFYEGPCPSGLVTSLYLLRKFQGLENKTKCATGMGQGWTKYITQFLFK